MNIIKDFFGLLKMVTSVCAVIMNIFVTIPLVLQDLADNEFGQLIGVLLGATLLTLYSAYLFYSGWTEFKSINILRPIFIWLGVVVGLVGGGLSVFSG